jgi:selenocysteine lyase/cysteine desulfurase
MTTPVADPVAEAARCWQPPAGPYLNTATFGLPPAATLEAVGEALEAWRRGDDAARAWTDVPTERARAAFARLVGVAPELVAAGAAVSEFVGLVAAGLPDRARVLAPETDFTSLLFPFLAQADRGVELRCVPAARLTEAVDGRTDLVAFSAVQSATGEVADLAAVAAAARHHGARTLVDATQACGWLPLSAADWDYLVCATYKWLCTPRGCAFLAMRPERLERLRPQGPGWFAAEAPWESLYGPPLRLAGSARRFDLSPAWFSWVGAAPSLELLERVGVAAVGGHDLALANRLRAGLGLAPSNSAIVAFRRPGAAERLARAGVRAAVRDGGVRVSCHLYNTPADVDAALDALGC